MQLKFRLQKKDLNSVLLHRGALLRSGEQDNLTRIRLQLAAYLFVGSRAAMHQLVRPWRGSVDGHGIGVFLHRLGKRL